MSKTTLPRDEKRIDFYPTPAWCVHRLLEEVDLPGDLWLEPAVGEGAIVRAVNAVRDDVSWTTVDIRAEVKPDVAADFVWMNCPELDEVEGESEGLWEVVITNPPFSQATEFVAHAVQRGSVAVMLLRLGWLSSEKRSGWLRQHMPDVYILPDRPSFNGEGSDSTDYAWMVWRMSELSRRSGRISVLRSTPLEERRAA